MTRKTATSFWEKLSRWGIATRAAQIPTSAARNLQP